MKNQATKQTEVINQTELQSQMFTIPNKAIVTDIVFNTGEMSQIVTAVPKGVFETHIQLGVIQALSMQNNIASCKSSVFSNCNGKIELTMRFDTHFFTEQNRIASPCKQEYLYSSVSYLN
ncbi:hypothetical protein N4T20_02240 [Flavobacterium sp. TR2]|uniref:hypothetical protein n=1 Tax=Flavobacterium sp. TR2 TaxID=2977321 RepID=UPI0021B09501|nr:hypothetical protein [Flavobacterium sp. TR2]UWY28754.1 hypothetical protein N4T20_02240 [Flavobacterium sp. TR2]